MPGTHGTLDQANANVETKQNELGAANEKAAGSAEESLAAADAAVRRAYDAINGITVRDDDDDDTTGGGAGGETLIEDEDVPLAEPPLVDVDSEYYEAIVGILNRGLMDPLNVVELGVNELATRADLIIALYRCVESPAVTGEMPFTDVEAGTELYNTVLWAYQQNIIDGAEKFQAEGALTNDSITAKTENLTHGDLALNLMRLITLIER